MSCISKSTDYLEFNSFDNNNHLQAVIEIPAGTNGKTAQIEFLGGLMKIWL